MPKIMPGSIGMPASTKPMLRAIQNIGRCSSTPAVTTPEPSQKPSALRRSANMKRLRVPEPVFPHISIGYHVEFGSAKIAGSRFSVDRASVRRHWGETMHRFYVVALVTALAAAAPGGASAGPAYDVVIRGGTIYDGSGGTPYVGDVAVKGDRIAAIAPHICRHWHRRKSTRTARRCRRASSTCWRIPRRA